MKKEIRLESDVDMGETKRGKYTLPMMFRLLMNVLAVDSTVVEK